MDYQEPINETYDEVADEPIVDLQRERDKRNLLLLGGIVIFTFVGILLYNFGVFQRDEPTSDHVLDRLSPPLPKEQEVEAEKYKNFSQEMRKRKREYNPTVTAFTERNLQTSKRSNESLGETDYREVQSRVSRSSHNSRPITKEALNRSFQQRNRAVRQRNQQLANTDTPIFQQTVADREAELQASEERAINRRTANLVLDQLERTNQQLSDDGRQYPAREGQHLSSGTLLNQPTEVKSSLTEKVSTTARMVPRISRNTIALAGNKNRFYSLSTATGKEYYTDNEAIPAVIHGDADGVQVTNGSTVKIRLIQAVTLLADGGQLALPAGTLLNGIVQVSGNRLQVSVATVRVKNSLYRISLQAYDLDGNPGLHVHGIGNKETLRRAVANSTTNSLSSGGFFTGGSIGQQVGTRLITQGVQSAVRGVQQVARQRVNNPKITIKSNYKILLKPNTNQ